MSYLSTRQTIKSFIVCSVIGLLLALLPPKATAFEWGFHILRKEEIETIIEYQQEHDLGELYVTVPIAVDETDVEGWNRFFSLAHKHQITPIVRLITRFENNNWARPSRKEIVQSADFLSSLFWPGKRYIVIFNEPNHAAEWGGQVDPEDYASRYLFAAQWFKTEYHDYHVMPAGLDLAAPDSSLTMSSDRFVEKMITSQPQIVDFIDALASHSYPNPGFVSSAYRAGKDSLHGFLHELLTYAQYGITDLPVFITETGWRDTDQTRYQLPNYYTYARDKIWSHPQVQGITIFITKGMSGPFHDFSLLDEEDQPTPQMQAILKAIIDQDE